MAAGCLTVMKKDGNEVRKGNSGPAWMAPQMCRKEGKMECDQQFLVGERAFTSDRGLDIRLNYYLTKKISQPDGGALYGIRIEKTTKGAGEESEQTPVLSASRQMVEEIVRRLMDGLVTPITMFGVIDDLVGQSCWEESCGAF